MLRMLGTGLLDAIFPPACLLCSEPPARLMLCLSCTESLSNDPLPACPRCAASVGPGLNLVDGCVHCQSESFYFDSALRLGVYDNRLREAILRIKRVEEEQLAETLGTLFAERLRSALESLNVDAVVPVPLHLWRQWRSGYNQAEAIAASLAAGLKVPCRPRWLRRIRNTPHQTDRSREERRENVRGAFRASRFAEFQGKRLLLVDDVMTTGATADAAALAMKKAGAAAVHVAVLARR